MKKRVPERRVYRKSARAEAERATGEAILAAAKKAFQSLPFDRVTLQAIAGESGVTVQTVIRRFTSKEELFKAMVERERPRILAARSVNPGAPLSEAIEALVDHYERDGDLILNFVAQEDRIEAVRKIVEEGRATHREWVKTHCRDLLSGVPEGSPNEISEHLVAAAFAATDIGTWKLLRRDLGHERETVVSVMTELISGLGRKPQ